MVRNSKGRRPATAALVGLLLALPGAALYVLLVLHIEPPLGFLGRDLSPDGPNVLGSLVALCLLVILPLTGFLLNLAPLRRAESGPLSRPANVAVAGACLIVVLLVVSSIMIDQYPCWVGVPNCD